MAKVYNSSLRIVQNSTNFEENVWNLNTGVESMVSVDGKDVVNKEFRNSVSIPMDFSITIQKNFPELSNGILGTATKHIYFPGNFMGKHRDSKKTIRKKKNKRYNTHTVIIFPSKRGWTGGELFIDGKEVNPYSSIKDYKEANPIVIFPYELEHEVKPVLSGERHVFCTSIFKKSKNIDVHNLQTNTIVTDDPGFVNASFHEKPKVEFEDAAFRRKTFKDAAFKNWRRKREEQRKIEEEKRRNGGGNTTNGQYSVTIPRVPNPITETWIKVDLPFRPSN